MKTEIQNMKDIIDGLKETLEDCIAEDEVEW